MEEGLGFERQSKNVSNNALSDTCDKGRQTFSLRCRV